MPLQKCSSKGKAGYRWGDAGACYTYPEGDEEARKKAKQKAILRGVAIEGGNMPHNPGKTMAEKKTKTCGECGENRPLDAYSADKRTGDGLGTVCSKCRFAGAETPRIVAPIALEEFTLDEARALLDLSDDEELVPNDDGEIELSDAHRETLAEIGIEGLDRLFVKGELDDVEDLPTVTLTAVPILDAGGPYFGHGSPAEGDYFDLDFLKTLVANTKAVSEVKAPNKIGHSKAQKLLRASKIGDDEQPAAGWLTNYRVKGKSILVDIPNVPRKLARLIKAGAFRTRSVELKAVTPQSGPLKGKKVTVISGLAWLGAVAPAVRTLDDVVKLYGGADVEASILLAEDAELDDDDVRTVNLAAGDIAWKPEEGYEWLRSEVRKALNPGPQDYRYWVEDVASEKALVGDGKTYWIVPFTVSDGAVEVAPSSDWIVAEKAWVEKASEYRDRMLSDALAAVADADAEAGARGFVDAIREAVGVADTSTGMPETTAKTKLSDEQITKLAEAFEIDEADDAKRREAVETKLQETVAETDTGGEGGGGEGGGNGEGGGDGTEGGTPPEVKPNEPVTGMSATERAEFEVLKQKAERGDKV